MRRRCALRACAALLVTALGGCGYRASLSLPEPYDAIGIEVFSNSSLEPDLEAELHRALTRTARELLDVPLVAPQRARLVLRGEILDYRRRGGIRSRENVQLETGLTIRTRAVLVDTLEGRALSGPTTVSTQVGYTLDQRTVNEADARRRVLDNVARRILLELTATATREPDATFEDRETGAGNTGEEAPPGGQPAR